MKILYFHFDLKRQNINFFKKNYKNLNTDLLCYRQKNGITIQKSMILY